MSAGLPRFAFKILTAAEWDGWQMTGVFDGAPIDLADGFIHLSTADQLGETLEKHFKGQDALVIAEIDLSKLDETVKWEPSRGGALFPHVYGPIPIAAVESLADAAELGSGHATVDRSSARSSG